MTGPVGLQIKAFNHPFRAAYRRRGFTLPKLALATGIGYWTLLGFENLKRWPSEDHQITLALCLETPEDEMFPEELQRVSGLGPTTIELAVSIEQAAGILVGSPDLDDGRLSEAVQAALATLPRRERMVIAMRFGLTDETADGDIRNEAPSGTLDAIATNMGVTRERIRQIESKALRHLRRSDTLVPLREFARDDRP